MRKSCFISSCLLACASISLSAQANLGSVNVGSNATTTVTVTIANAGTLNNIYVSTAGAPNRDFTNAGSGTCSIGAPYAAKATCTVEVKFAPTTVGSRYGAILLTNHDSSIATTEYLQGAGDGPMTSFLPATPFYPLTEFYAPQGVAVDSNGGVYAAEGLFTPVHDLPPNPGYLTSNVGFYTNTIIDPSMVAVDGAGNVHSSGGSIYVRQANGSYGLANTFQRALVIDGAGNLYRLCSSTTGVCKATLQADGTYVESTVAAGFSPTGIAVDGSGNVFLADSSVYEFSPSGTGYTQSTVFSGSPGAASVATDGLGDVFFLDAAGSVYKETLQSDGSFVKSAISTGIGLANAGLAADSEGDAYFFAPDGKGQYGATNGVLEEDSSIPPTLTFASTLQGSSTGSQVATVTNFGNAPLQFSSVTYPADFPEASTSATECTATTTLTTGENCTLTIKFAPISPLNGSSSLALSEKVTIATNTLNAPSTQQSITVTGTELPGPTATPTFSLPAGVYYTTQTVTISDATPGATIYYTLNGSQPTTSSLRYRHPVTIAAAETLKAIAVAPGFAPSNLASAYYALTAPTPVISPISGSYSGPQTVTISTATPIEAIFYTTAGNLPTTSSAHYTGPITVSSTEKVIAFAAQTGFISSPFVSQKFTITPPGVQGNFGTVHIGSSVTGSVTLNLSVAGKIGSVTVGAGGATNLDFTQLSGGTCAPGATFGPGSTCTVYVKFQPLHAGTRYGFIVVKDSQNNVMAESNIYGIGDGPQTSFGPGKETNFGLFPKVTGLAVDGSGKFYISLGTYNNGASNIAGGLVTLTPNGAGGYTKSTDTSDTDPQGVWSDQSGNLYVYDSVKGLLKNGVAILPGVQPLNLAGDAAGNLFIVESGSNLKLKETLQPDGTYAQSTIDFGYTNPYDIWLDGADNLYVIDDGGISKGTWQSGVGYVIAFQTQLFGKEAVDLVGDIYGFNPSDHLLHKKAIQVDGSYVDSKVLSGIANPGRLTADGLGSIYFANSYSAVDETVLTDNFTLPPTLTFASTQRNSVSGDSPKKVTISNSGTEPLQFTAVTYPADFPESSAATGDCTASTTLAPGSSCTITATFAPVTPSGNPSVLLTESVTVTTNTLNAPSTTQSITVTGTETN